MKRYFVQIEYTVQATAQFEIDEHQLRDALEEERLGTLTGEDLIKAKNLFSKTGEDIADEISQSTWDYKPLELGSMNFLLRQDYRTDEAAEADQSGGSTCTEIEPKEIFLRLNRVAWVDNVEVEEDESTY
jgi:hypothetical protein